MKRLFFSLVFLIISITLTNAQPSKSAMIAKIKGGETYLSVELLEGTPYKEFENGKYHYYFEQYYKTRWKSKKYPGVIEVYNGSMTYEKIGGRYVYSRDYTGYNSYEGVQNPTIADVKRIANKNMYSLLGSNYYDKAIELIDISFPEKNVFKYDKINSAEFDVLVTLKELHGNKLSTIKHKLHLNVLSDGFKKPWNKIFSTGKAHNYTDVVISEKELSNEELKNIKTIDQAIIEKEAEEILSKLVKVDEIPKFQS